MAPMAEMRRESTFAPLECQEALLAMLSGPTCAERPIRCYNLDPTPETMLGIETVSGNPEMGEVVADQSFEDGRC